MPFPPEFVWGAASSAYQIEGAAAMDGRGPSVWDAFCTIPGATFRGHTGAVACDHYHRFKEDVALMRAIGLRAYRFSISWSRVLPDGTGAPNETGLAFYSALVDELLAAGIEPWVTLYHWDLPLSLQHRGGWLNRDIAEWFDQYTRLVVARLSDRVTRWITINEPQIFIGFGHGEGTHAPGRQLAMADRLLAGHHALLAHGRSVATIRRHAKRPPSIGWAPIGRVRFPASDHAEDITAARLATCSVLHKDFWNNTWFGDPVCLGHYPEDGLRLFGSDAPEVRAGDLEQIHQPLDFYGVNIYDGEPYRRGHGGEPQRVDLPTGHPQTALRWFITPEALYWGPKFLYERYKIPIVVTENGLSNTDWVDLDGIVQDPQRIDYTRRYLLALQRAIDEGTDVRGYFHWSILDNFEWQEGYKERFGLIHVDYPTQRRTLKSSAHWYRAVIESQGGTLRAGQGPGP